MELRRGVYHFTWHCLVNPAPSPGVFGVRVGNPRKTLQSNDLQRDATHPLDGHKPNPGVEIANDLQKVRLT